MLRWLRNLWPRPKTRYERLSEASVKAGRHGMYVIDPIEYVDPLPPLGTSLFDDPERTREIFTTAIESLGPTAERIRTLTEEDDERIREHLKRNLEGRDG